MTFDEVNNKIKDFLTEVISKMSYEELNNFSRRGVDYYISNNKGESIRAFISYIYIHSENIIEDLGLTVRTTNCLRKAGIHFIKDLLQKTPDELLRIENLGVRSLREIIYVLKERGLNLKDSELLEEEKKYIDYIDFMALITKLCNKT